MLFVSFCTVFLTSFVHGCSMNGAQFRGEKENLSSSADDISKTSNLVISCCCFADDGKEIDKSAIYVAVAVVVAKAS